MVIITLVFLFSIFSFLFDFPFKILTEEKQFVFNQIFSYFCLDFICFCVSIALVSFHISSFTLSCFRISDYTLFSLALNSFSHSLLLKNPSFTFPHIFLTSLSCSFHLRLTALNSPFPPSSFLKQIHAIVGSSSSSSFIPIRSPSSSFLSSTTSLISSVLLFLSLYFPRLLSSLLLGLVLRMGSSLLTLMVCLSCTVLCSRPAPGPADPLSELQTS